MEWVQILVKLRTHSLSRKRSDLVLHMFLTSGQKKLLVIGERSRCCWLYAKKPTCLHDGILWMVAKSCITLDGWNTINIGINHLLTGAGFRNHPPYDDTMRREVCPMFMSVTRTFGSWTGLSATVLFFVSDGIGKNVGSIIINHWVGLRGTKYTKRCFFFPVNIEVSCQLLLIYQSIESK